MSELPDTWAWTTVGIVTDYIQRGKSPKYADRSSLPVINQKCIRWSELQLQHLKYIHPDQIEAWDEARYLRPGDILWNSTGTGTVGRAYLVSETDCTPPKVVDSHVTIVRSSKYLEPRYLFNWIKSPAVQTKIEEMCDGTTNQIELSRTAISSTAIPIPPQQEQSRIADQLDTLLARIKACNDHLDAIPGLLKRFRQSVLTAAMSGSLTTEWRDTEARHGNLPAFLEGDLGDATQSGSPFSMPSSWRIVLARNLVQPEAGIVYGIVQPGPKLADGIRYVQITDIVDGSIQIQSLSHTSEEIANGYQRSSIRKGDVLLGIIRALKVAVVPDELEGANISRSVARLRPREGVSPKFLAYALQSPAVQEWLRSQHRGMDMPVLNLSEVRLAPIPIAPTDEQAEIVRRVDALFMLADRIQAAHAVAVAQVRRLSPLTLAKAFRGELVPQDLNDEPASALLQRIAKTRASPAKAPADRTRRNKAGASLPSAVQAELTAGCADGVVAEGSRNA